MADVFRLTKSDVDSAASLFQDAAGQTGDLINSLKSRVESLSGGWEGDSYNAFSSMFSDISTNLRQVVELYEQMSMMLTKAAEAAMEVDAGLASGMSGT